MADIDPNAVTDPNAGVDPNPGAAGGGSGSEGDGDKPVSRAELDKIMARMRAADQRATNAEKARDENKAALDKIETDKLGDVEKAKKEAADAVKLAESQANELKSTRMETAFVKVNDVKWHDVETAYEILLKDYAADIEYTDGKVSGMKEAVAKLAKAKPFLINTALVEPANGATGGTHNGRKGATDAAAATAEQKRRFPAAYRHHGAVPS